MKPYYEHAGITIYHGDCREVLPGLGDSSIDFIFTDPPYGHNNNNGDLIHRWPSNCQCLIRWSFSEWNRLLGPGCCCCCGGGPDPQFARWSLWLDEAIGFKQMVVWDKGPIGMGWHYRRSYETVLVGEKPGAACRWYDETNQVENIVRYIPKIRQQLTWLTCSGRLVGGVFSCSIYQQKSKRFSGHISLIGRVMRPEAS